MVAVHHWSYDTQNGEALLFPVLNVDGMSNIRPGCVLFVMQQGGAELTSRFVIVFFKVEAQVRG